MESNYQTAFRLIRQVEGGFAQLRGDPGGATNHGITQRSYDAFRLKNNLIKQSVKHISEAEVQAIYRREYAQPIRFEQLPRGLDYMLFDFAIHSGVARAVQELQRVLKLKMDGILGVRTLQAIESFIKNSGTEALLMAVHRQRQRFIRGLKHYPHFKTGWENRLNFVHRHALAMLETQPRADVEIAPPVVPSERARGRQSLSASIAASRRSRAALFGGAGMLLSAMPEALQLAQPAREAFAVGQYAAWIGAAITAVALLYIVGVRARAADD